MRLSDVCNRRPDTGCLENALPGVGIELDNETPIGKIIFAPANWSRCPEHYATFGTQEGNAKIQITFESSEN